jgi:large conductance mechanosensitive channel
MFKEFKSFVLRGNVVELAVALVIGAAFANVVTAVVDLLTNILAIPGKTDFSELQFTIGGGVFKYGALLNAVIVFLTVAAVIFFLIVRPLNKLAERRRAGAEPAPEARPDDVLLLEEIRDLLRAQQAGTRRRPVAAPEAAAKPPAEPQV